MEYNIAAKPTIYKGFRFRSRLEARWAVFFDQIGVRWEYEPASIQTDAGQVTPDFIIVANSPHNGSAAPILVEVKPLNALPGDGTFGMYLAEVALRYAQAIEQMTEGADYDEECGYLIVVGDPYDAQGPLSVRRGLSQASFQVTTITENDREGFEELCLEDYSFRKDSNGAVSMFYAPDSDFEKEALYARQYDFMHFLPN